MRKKLITKAERQLFKDAVKYVVPLSSDNRIPAHQQKPAIYPKARQGTEILEKGPFYDNTNAPSVQAETLLQFVRPGLQHRIIQRLKRGEFRREGLLDLHGYNLNQAHELLFQFLNHAMKKQWRCVQIIHGKGIRGGQVNPLLKNAVNRWLRSYPQVLAFCSAKPDDGGAGSVYILLKAERST